MNLGLAVLAALFFIGLVSVIGYGSRLEQRVSDLEEQKRRQK
jgi:hypothetical protein